MPEIRRNPFLDTMVILSEARRNRPNAFQGEIENNTPENCPFCPGNEFMTPEATFQINKDQTMDKKWDIRVFPNKYPALNNNSSFIQENSPFSRP